MTSKKVVRVPAVCYLQNGKTLYSFAAPIAEVVEHLDVDRWDPELDKGDPDYFQKQGYQRTPNKTHYSKVARHYRDEPEPLMPNSILLAARGALRFEVVEELPDGRSLGFLVLDKDTILWIVDGQHRVWGARYAKERYKVEIGLQMHMAFTVLTNIRKITEVRQFFLVNSTAKRIRTDLAEELLLEVVEEDDEMEAQVIRKGDKWKLRKTRLSTAISQREGSPWEGRIKFPNSEAGGIASSSSFGTSLKPLLTGGFTEKLSDDDLLVLIDNYWRALRDLMPEAFADPENYVVQKTPGMYTLHLIAPRVFEICRGVNDYSVERIKEVLTQDEVAAEYFESHFWRGRGGDGEPGEAASANSMGAFRELADRIERRLPEVKIRIAV